MRDATQGAGLNPALREARFCPRCGQPAEIAYPRSITCPHCGYGAYYNPKPVAAAIPVTPAGEIILLRRAFDPGKDLWTFPGGFVDLGESVQQAAHREVREELDIAIELGALVGVYSRPDSHIVLIVYSARTTEEPRRTEEASEVRRLKAAEIPWDELAFWSTRDALQDFLS
jgi:ADP-ribose pyrophosphatase YjhB (NUDIX family)